MTDRKQELTAERLREVLAYDPETGVFTRKVRTTQQRKGRGRRWKHCDAKGYITSAVTDGAYASHTAWPGCTSTANGRADQIDHINGDQNRTTESRIFEKRNARREPPQPARASSAQQDRVSWRSTRSPWEFQSGDQVDGKQ